MVKNWRAKKKKIIVFLVKISSRILLCILGELAEGGSVAVAVGVSDMRQETPNTQHMTL